MVQEKKWAGKWLQDSRLDGLKPINVFRKVKDRESWLAEVEGAHPPELRNIHFMVRRKLVLNAPARTALLQITADDHYKLYVNGTYVGEGPAPAFPWSYWFDTWDIKPFLREGENVIAVHAYYQGLWNFRWVSADLRMGLVAECDIETADGKTVSVHTDESWLAHMSNAWPEATKMKNLGIRVQPLEHIDSRLLPHGWRDPGFDDSTWIAPSCVNVEEKDYKFYPPPTPPLSIYRVKPKVVKKIAAGRFLLDFGKELTGTFGMSTPGEAGRVVEVRHAEELDVDGSARFNMRANCIYSENWTLSDRPVETLEQYDYKGFRYVEVVNANEKPNSKNSWVTVRHYPFPEGACSFRSSSDVLNRIWDICAHGTKLCGQENFVDCPTREKGQYAGDNTIAAHAHLLLTGDNRLARKSITDLALTSRICPGFITTAPCSRMHEIADYSLQFPLQLERDFAWSGDKEFLGEMLPVAEGLLKHFAQFENRDGLLESLNEKWNLVDWPPVMRDGYDFELVDNMERPLPPGPHNVLNAWYIGAIDSVSRLRAALNMPAIDSSRNKAAFRATFRNPATGLFIDRPGSSHSSMHSNALPLYFGFVADADRLAVIDFLKSRRMACGVYMSYFLLKALYGAGQGGFAYDLMTCDDLYSWQSMLKAGATACTEAWSPELKRNGSMCHAWSAAPIVMVIEHIMGITPTSPGWDGVRFEPNMPAGLDWAELKLTTPRGEIKAAVRREGDRVVTGIETPVAAANLQNIPVVDSTSVSVE